MPLTWTRKNPQFLCRSHPRFPQLLKAAFNAPVADERALEGPEELTGWQKPSKRLVPASKPDRLGFIERTWGLCATLSGEVGLEHIPGEYTVSRGVLHGFPT